MTLVTSNDLLFLGSHCGTLATLYAQQPNTIRAVHIRRAERSLVALEEFVRGHLPLEAQQWLKAKDAFKILEQKQSAVEELQASIASQQAEIDDLTNTLRLWNGLQDAERLKLVQNHARAKQFVDQNLAHAEAHILHKYSRYKTLNRLLPYADNAEHLCDAIFHFQNRQRYEENIQKIEQRRENALERLASVKRGFNLALFLCALIVTLPLCVPVAYSLWNRKRDIEHQIANMIESQKREERRLQIADEGVIASEEIKEILGDVPLDVVRRTLEELRELRSEFQRVEKNPSTTAALVSFVDLYKPRLRSLFGDVPDDMAKVFPWFKDEVDRVLNVEAERGRLLKRLDDTKNEMKRLLKGHTEFILRDSFNRMKAIVETNFSIEIEESLKVDLAQHVGRLPDLLRTARVLLSNVSHGMSIDGSIWFDVYRWFLSIEANVSAMALELQLAGESSESISPSDDLLEQMLS